MPRIVLAVAVVVAIVGLVFLVDLIFVTEEERIEKVIEEMRQALVDRDVESCFSHFSSEHLAPGFNVQVLQDRTETEVERSESREIDIRSVKITVDGETAEATIGVKVSLSGNQVYNIKSASLAVEASFRLEEDNWRVTSARGFWLIPGGRRTTDE